MVDEGERSGVVFCGSAAGVVVEAVRLGTAAAGPAILLNRVAWRKEAWVEAAVIVDRGMQDRRGCIARMILLGRIFV